MPARPIDTISALTFDVSGTILDLSGSLVPPLERLLSSKEASVDVAVFWNRWRARQRIEQFQDTMLMMGHSGYLETCRRALVYCLRAEGIAFTYDEVDEFMGVWQDLAPFDDAVQGLERLRGTTRLVALSNGETWFLEHLVKNRTKVPFDESPYQPEIVVSDFLQLASRLLEED